MRLDGPGSYLSSPRLVAAISTRMREGSMPDVDSRSLKAVTPMRTPSGADMRVRTPMRSSMVARVTGMPPLNCMPLFS